MLLEEEKKGKRLEKINWEACLSDSACFFYGR